MNDNIDLTKILKDCPKGFPLYSNIFGSVYFKHATPYNIYVVTTREMEATFGKNGHYFAEYEDVECSIFPSRYQRDWSKFTAPWYKKDKFDPKTLRPFDKVLFRDHSTEEWDIGHFSYIEYDLAGFDLSDCEKKGEFLVHTAGGAYYWYAVPYNEDTKHLVGKADEAPEYYRYWED